MDPFYYSDDESNTNNEAFKAVDIAQGDLFDLFGKDTTVGFKDQKSPWLIREDAVKVVDTLETMVRYFWLVSLDPTDSFNSLVEALKLTGYNNHQPNLHEKCIYGFLFSGAKYAEYKLDLFKYEGKMGVECIRLSGCAFLLNEFQDALEKQLRDSGYMKFEDESDTESDFEIEFSDDEDVDFSFGAPTLAPQSNFLDLTEDGDYVESLIEDIQNPNFQVDSLLTVAHNACQAENMKALQAYDTQLFSACVASLAAAGYGLAIVRSAVLIIAQLLKNDKGSLKVTGEQYTVIAATLLAWLSGNDANQTVTVSEEVVDLIAQQLQTLNNRAQQTEECKNILNKVYSEAKSTHLRNSINRIITAC